MQLAVSPCAYARAWWDVNRYLFVKYEPVVRAQIAGPYTYRLPISQQFGASRLLLALPFFTGKCHCLELYSSLLLLLFSLRSANTEMFCVLQIGFRKNVLRNTVLLPARDPQVIFRLLYKIIYR